MRSTPLCLVCVTILFTCLTTTPWLLAGCGSEDGPHLPAVTPSVMVGPGPGEATVGVLSSGSGRGVAGLVLTYPNGHRNQVGTVVLEDGLGGSVGLRGLDRGRYTFTVYATTTSPDAGAFPKEARVDDNIIGSLEFTVD